jgi:transposase-like protein
MSSRNTRTGTTAKARQMAALMSECDRSGIPQATFAREHGITPGAFAWWRHALGRQRSAPKRRPVRFVEVTPTSRDVARTSPSRSPLLIRMPSGVMVRVGADVDATAFETVMAVLVRTC